MAGAGDGGDGGSGGAEGGELGGGEEGGDNDIAGGEELVGEFRARGGGFRGWVGHCLLGSWLLARGIGQAMRRKRVSKVCYSCDAVQGWTGD